MMRHMLARLALAGVLLVAGVLYLRDLDRVPIYLGWDEARFALQGHAIATTGRDLNGHRTPLFFHNTDPLIPGSSSRIWWQPVLIYLIAAVLRVAPLSEWSVRLPIAALALLNVGLVYLIGRRLFANAWYGVLAALILVMTPAHLIFGRMASDYFCPVPFALIWLWCLLRCLQTEARWMPAVTGLVLGIGLYSYIASWLIMPFYFVVTQIALWLSRKPLRAHVSLALGFALPLLALVPWIVLHPETPGDTFRGYAVSTSFRLAERVSLYWDYFNPSYLFFSGGSDLMWATRRAGVFALAVAVLLPCGIWSIARKPSVARVVVLIGFFFAPVPIIVALPEAPNYATARDLLALPFGALLSVAGVQWLVADRRSGNAKAGRTAAALLLASIPLQFAFFARDYFADYQSRSGYRLDSANMRDVAAYVIASDRAARVPAVYLSEELGTGKSVQWMFHLVKNQRNDLWQRTQYFNLATFNPNDIPPGSLLVVDMNNRRVNDLVGPDRCSIAHVVTDVANAPTATILRRN
jgi:4-amino-4-deoxy-L-arabinose transferase-like glycosyltransferase